MIMFECPQCNRTLSFQPEQAGQEAPCPYCGWKVYVNPMPDEIDKASNAPNSGAGTSTPPFLPLKAGEKTRNYGGILLAIMWLQLFAIFIAFIVACDELSHTSRSDVNTYALAFFVFALAVAVQLVFMAFVKGLISDNGLLFNYVLWLNKYLPEIVAGKQKWPEQKKENKESK